MNENMKIVLNLPYLFSRCIQDYETATALATSCRSFYNIVHKQKMDFSVDRKDSTPLTLLLDFDDDIMRVQKYLKRISKLNLFTFTLFEKYYDFDLYNTLRATSARISLLNEENMNEREGLTRKELIDNYIYLFSEEIKMLRNLKRLCFNQINFRSFASNSKFLIKCMNSIKSTKLKQLTGITYNTFLTFFLQMSNYFISNLPNLNVIEIICNQKSYVRARDAELIGNFSKALGNCNLNFVVKNILYAYPKWSLRKQILEGNLGNDGLSQINLEDYNKGAWQSCENRNYHIFVKKLRSCQKVFKLVMQLKQQNVLTNYSVHSIINGSYFLFIDNLPMGNYSFLQYVGFTINFQCTPEAISRMIRNITLFNDLKGFEIIFDSFAKPQIFNTYKKLLLCASNKIKLFKVQRCPFVDCEFAKSLATRYSHLKCIKIGFLDRARTFVSMHFFAEFEELDSIFVDFWRTTWTIPSKVRLFVIKCAPNEETIKHTFYDRDSSEVQLKNRFVVANKETRGKNFEVSDLIEKHRYQIVYCYTILDWKLFEELTTFHLSYVQTPEYCFL